LNSVFFSGLSPAIPAASALSVGIRDMEKKSIIEIIDIIIDFFRFLFGLFELSILPHPNWYFCFEIYN
jgi:hypothetical protein